jgi:hypothetical protein
MKSLILAFLLLYVTPTFAQQFDTMQSSPSFDWKTISNDYVQVIYPDYLQGESVYIANLVEHYAKFVGQTYGIKDPQLFRLIIRPEPAEPNGFVTLAPRRSEWFSSSMFSPYVGSAEWYQILSIHEYRHVNQFDYFNQRGTRYFYYVMGEMGVNVATFFTMPSWFMEGDAVWTETKYTDAGRGRSPRFLARLKALVMSQKIPTFDEFLNGSYQTSLPNQYVYGYALISYGTQKYGEDLWQKVIWDNAHIPSPMHFYYAFENVTGQNFQDFYTEAMNDLRNKWASDKPSTTEAEQDYYANNNPAKIGEDLYFVNSNLDKVSAIYKQHGNEEPEKLVELPYFNELQAVGFGKTKAVINEFLPGPRYQFRNYSDLFVYDLKSGSKDKITEGQRLYNPRFNNSETKIIAADFTPSNAWNLSEYSIDGKLIQSFALKEGKFEEGAYLDDSHVVAVLTNKTGLRFIATIDLKSRTVMKTLLPPSRNLVYGLNVDTHKNIFFEGQYKGHNEILKITEAGETARCTQARIGAYLPFSNGDEIFYGDIQTYGTNVAHAKISTCQSLPSAQLVDFNYLGSNPSDNYNGFPVQSFPDQAELDTKNSAKYQPESYGDFDTRLVIPHSWGLIIGRGFGLGAQTDNYLHTLSLQAMTGVDAEEAQAFAEFNFDIKKYYPLLRVQAETRDRRVTDYDTNNVQKWNENTIGLEALVPYTFKRGVYNFTAYASATAGYTNTDDYEFNDVKYVNSSYFYKTGGEVGFAWGKDKAQRSLQEPWLLSYRLRYDNADHPSDSKQSSFRNFQEGIVQTPGVWKHDGLKLVFDQQKQFADVQAYRFLPVGDLATGYVFSRGYSFEDVPGYQKLSANYLFPLLYPDLTFGKWYYLRRLWANLFFDSTTLQETAMPSTLNSYGLEMNFESVIVRTFPLTFGARVLQRLLDNEVMVQVYLSAGSLF